MKPFARFPTQIGQQFERLGVSGRVLLAVSGGADSLALLRATQAISDDLGLELIVAHFDHSLRSESAADAEWVSTLAMSLGIRCVTERGDVKDASEKTGRGIEETARRLRYEFLVRAAERCGAPFVATAHTADDLAETVLFHILRGTGLRGLRGIPPRRRLSRNVTLVRPMLEVTRVEVEDYLQMIGQPFLHDPTNAGLDFTRNRLRNAVLPQLREAVNPRLDDALRRLSRQSNEISQLLTRLAHRELRRTLIESTPGVIRLRSRRLATQAKPLIRETVALAWRQAAWPRQSMNFEHWDALAHIVVHGGRRTLPEGTDARRRQGELILRRTAAQ